MCWHDEHYMFLQSEQSLQKLFDIVIMPTWYEKKRN